MGEYIRYATQCLAATNSSSTWETDAEKVKAYLGFMMVMGINRLPEIQDYWSSDSKLGNTFISSCITRTRFEEISRYLHFVDNDDLPARDEPSFHRLQKVMPVLQEVRKRCVGNYNPNRENTVDEAMIPFKGVCTYKEQHCQE